jgi:hypothetical protein
MEKKLWKCIIKSKIGRLEMISIKSFIGFDKIDWIRNYCFFLLVWIWRGSPIWAALKGSPFFPLFVFLEVGKPSNFLVHFFWARGIQYKNS